MYSAVISAFALLASQVAAVYSIARHERDVNTVMEGGKDTPAPKPQKKRVWASLEHEPPTVIAQMFDEANRRDPKHKREWAVLVDGQRSQLDRVEQQIESCGLAVTIIVDLIPVLEYRWKASCSFHAEATTESGYFSRLSSESGGIAIFINDYAEQLPDFIPLFPNDEQYIGRLKAANVQVAPWQDAADAEAIGFGGLKLDARSLRKTELDIEAIISGRGDSPLGQNPTLGFHPLGSIFPSPIKGPEPIVIRPIGIDPRRDPPIVPGLRPGPMRPPLLSGPGRL
jgi:hypothetical protein